MHKYDLDIYPISFFVSIGESDDAVIKAFDFGKNKDTDFIMPEDADAYTVPVSVSYNFGVLVRFNGEASALTEGLIAHECLHALLMFCESLGVKVVSDNDEPCAYLLQWLVTNVNISKQAYLDECKAKG